MATVWSLLKMNIQNNMQGEFDWQNIFYPSSSIILIIPYREFLRDWFNNRDCFWSVIISTSVGPMFVFPQTYARQSNCNNENKAATGDYNDDTNRKRWST